MSVEKQRIVFCRICLLRHISVFISTKKLSERLPKRLANFYCIQWKTKHRFLSNLSFTAYKRVYFNKKIVWKITKEACEFLLCPMENKASFFVEYVFDGIMSDFSKKHFTVKLHWKRLDIFLPCLSEKNRNVSKWCLFLQLFLFSENLKD